MLSPPTESCRVPDPCKGDVDCFADPPETKTNIPTANNKRIDGLKQDMMDHLLSFRVATS